jgi:hypothetical protein
LIAVVDDVVRPPLCDRHIECRQDQVGRHLLTDGPANDTPTPHIKHDGQIDKPRPRRHIGHICHPQPVRLSSNELAIDQIRRWPLAYITLRRHDPPAASAHTAQLRTPH